MRIKQSIICGMLSLLITGGIFAAEPDTISTEPFTRIDVSSEIDAELVLTTKPGLSVEFTETNEDQLIYEVEAGTLKLRMQTGKYEEEDLKVKIFFTELEQITSSGRASIWSYEDIWFSDVTMNLSNGGAIRLNIVADHLDAELIQGSILSLAGTTKTMNVRVSTAATFDAYELKAEEAEVLSNSGGKAKVSVTGILKAKATSGGFIGYVGDPEVDAKTSFRGEVVRTYLD